MRYLAILLLCASACLAQQTQHNEEFGFTITIPSGWQIVFEDEWSFKVKDKLEEQYVSKPLFLLKPANVEISDSCIMVFGRKVDEEVSSLATAFVEQSAEKMMTSDMLAKEILGPDIETYQKVNSSYDRNSSENLSIARVIYQDENDQGRKFITAWAKFFVDKKDINLRGYSKSKPPDQFWSIFRDVVGSVYISSHDVSGKNISSEGMLNQVMKWGGIILTISIILGIAKIIFAR